ncbi:Hsp70 family protein [Streptomyces sp. H27-C3]|uniref:Hsp70 family protein n=1 Tax=Streptomyces sp. H27-C3 TaxID=3046305 RepID=UPI0024BB8080|nr:Hsp70 family protein [Streptomyces sp. H27-C3]MDJ0465264.1 Hsp70 family protein [Streptomyces sp. H27-C3]
MPYRTLGIDLGTTNSVTAWLDGGVPVVLSNRHKEQATPSAVGVAADGSLLVGSEALGSRDRLPGSVITEVKRLIGRNYADVDVQRIIRERPDGERLVRESADGGVEIRLGVHYLTPVQISAILLRRLRTDAENTAGEAFRRAVITVPAYFTEPQYAAVREAGELAGFTVTRILPEPTAAAHAFGVGRPVQDDDDMCSVLVYDLGGGTFDVSLLITGPGYFEVYGLSGDKALGGADFDHALHEMLTTRLGDRDHSGSNDAGRIRAAAERTKIELSSVPASEIVLGPLGKNGGSWTGKVTRADFEQLIHAGIARTLDITRTVLRDASRTPEDIDKVLLVGGSTRIPLVRRLLTELFDKDKVRVSHQIDPMAAVALGAAVETGLVRVLPCPSEPCLTTGIPLTENACPDCGASLLGTATVDCPGCHVPAAEGTSNCPVCAADLSGLRAAAPVAARGECPHCGCRENSTSATACQDCDRPLDAGGLKCPQCQMVNATGLTACSACDALFHTDQPEQVTAQNLGLALNDGTVAVLFPAGTKYPTAWQNIENLRVRSDDATALTFQIVEGPHDKAHSRNEFCGEHTHHLGAGSGSAERLILRVQIDENRTVHLKYRVGDGEEVGARLRRNAVAGGIGRDAAHLLREVRTHREYFGSELTAAESDTFAELTEQLSAIVRGEPLGRSLDGFLDGARTTLEACRNARSWTASASIGAQRGRELGLDQLAGELGDARRALDSARERMDLPAMQAATGTARGLWRKIDAAVWRSMVTAHNAEIGRFRDSVRRSVLTTWDELCAAAARRDYAAQDTLHKALENLNTRSEAPDPAAQELRGSAQVFPERR